MTLPPLSQRDPRGDEDDQLSLDADDPEAFDGLSFGEWIVAVSQANAKPDASVLNQRRATRRPA